MHNKNLFAPFLGIYFLVLGLVLLGCGVWYYVFDGFIATTVLCLLIGSTLTTFGIVSIIMRQKYVNVKPSITFTEIDGTGCVVGILSTGDRIELIFFSPEGNRISSFFIGGKGRHIVCDAIQSNGDVIVAVFTETCCNRTSTITLNFDTKGSLCPELSIE